MTAIRAAAWLAAALLVAAPPAHAEVIAPPAHAEVIAPPAHADDDTLLGDAGGLRPALAARGVTVSLSLATEAWSGLAGGLRRGTRLGGMALAGIAVDTEQAGLWAGGQLFVSLVASFGRFPGAELVGGLQSPTSTEAPRGALLYEAWYEHRAGPVALRLGQLRADAEFLTSTYDAGAAPSGAGTLFANASFGFPGLYGLAMPGGGPAYPLATPGIRLKLAPDAPVRLLAAVFNGTPRRSAFGLRGGALAMVEAQYLSNQAAGLPGMYRLGAWFHTQAAADPRIDSAGRSLADPLSTGAPRRHAGNWGVYVMADRMLLQTGASALHGIGVSARLLASPGQRNPADLQANLAVTWKGALPGRDDDTLGLGVTFLRMGPSLRGLDRDTAAFSGGFTPLRGNETVMEATYQVALAGWWQVQPSLQYILRPGAGLADPNRPGRTLRDAWVLGLRSTVAF